MQTFITTKHAYFKFMIGGWGLVGYENEVWMSRSSNKMKLSESEMKVKRTTGVDTLTLKQY